MKKFKALISAILVFSIILSFGNVFAATADFTDLGGGYYGYKLNSGTSTSVSDDGTLTVTQIADTIYNYVDTNNFLFNPGFEESDVTDNVGGKSFYPLTVGWTIPYSNKNLPFYISKEAHSGLNSIYLEVPVATTNLSNGMLLNEKNIMVTSDISTDTDGRINGLSPDTKYVISYWVKGTAATRAWLREIDPETGKLSGTNITTSANNIVANPDGWTLFTAEFTPNSAGEIYWVINYTCDSTNITEAYVDDVQIVTKEQSIANVVSMIEKLDVTSKTAARAIDDIEQWCAKLGAENISNYADFETKVKEYSPNAKYEYVITNGYAPKNNSFELSDEAEIIHRRSNTYFNITDGWMTNWTMNSEDKPFQNASISKDAHSGNNSLYVNITSNDGSAYPLTIYNNDAMQGTVPYMQYDSANTTYLVSVWLKGAQILGGTKAYSEPTGDTTEGSWSTSTSWSTNRMDADAGDNWTLYTFEIKTNSLGQACWLIQVRHTADTTIEVYLDDIHVATKEQYIANVETMIKNLDTTSANSARAIDDIEQWITVLGSENISNYDLFVMKKSGYVYYSEANPLTNAGFENSDDVNSFSGDGYAKELTTGWTTNYGSSKVIYSNSNDSHSGKNAMSVEVVAGNNTRLFNTNNMVYTSSGANNTDLDYRTKGLKSNTEYIISYWVKGTGQTHVWGRTVDSNGANSGEYRGAYITNPGDKWTLGTNRLTTNENGEFWFNIFTNNPVGEGVDASTVENITAIIDDIQVLTIDEAVANVDAMIEAFAKLDSTDANYARANDDIKQWVETLNNAELNVKYDIVLNGKDNIITPNSGYTHLAQGDYIASVSLKGDGIVNRVYGDNITNIASIATTLASDFVTYSKRVTVGAYGTHYMGVQLTDTTDVNTVEFKDFSLKRVGDVNESGEIDIRDMVRMVKGLNGTDNTVDSLVADYDNSDTFDKDDIASVREKIMNTDKLADILRGKTVSVIGDSISTFDGYNNNIYSNTTTVNNSVCYYDGKPNKYDDYGNYLDWQDMKVDDMYWKQLIDITETRLLVNNAWSGSSIARQGGARRGVQLHDNYGYYIGETPDIILVHYGTNDYLSYVSQGDEAYGVENFAASYDEMVAAMLDTYPGVDIYLFTFPPYKTNAEHVALEEEYNDKIREIAKKYNCPLVDLYNDSAFNLETFKELTVEGLHPNKAGMDAITDTIYNVMCEQYIK